MERVSEMEGQRESKREREREEAFGFFPFYQGALCKPAAVLNQSHHPLTAILKQEAAASHCLRGSVECSSVDVCFSSCVLCCV